MHLHDQHMKTKVKNCINNRFILRNSSNFFYIVYIDMSLNAVFLTWWSVLTFLLIIMSITPQQTLHSIIVLLKPC